MRLSAQLCGRRVRDISGTNTSLHTRNATPGDSIGLYQQEHSTLTQGNHSSWHSALLRATANTTGSFGHPQYMPGTDKPEWVWWRATKMLRGTKPHEERLWEMQIGEEKALGS